MAMIGAKDVIGGSIGKYVKGKLNAKIYGNYPKQKYIYLHYLPVGSFKQTKIDKHQYVSKDSVNSIKTERIKVSDYNDLAPLATKEETKEWIKKYG